MVETQNNPHANASTAATSPMTSQLTNSSQFEFLVSDINLAVHLKFTIDNMYD